MKEQKIIPIPIRKVLVDVDGCMTYSENIGAWNLIRLRTDFIKRLPRLRDKNADVYYKIVGHYTFEELIQELKEMQKRGEDVPPLTLRFYEVKDE